MAVCVIRYESYDTIIIIEKFNVDSKAEYGQRQLNLAYVARNKKSIKQRTKIHISIETSRCTAQGAAATRSLLG